MTAFFPNDIGNFEAPWARDVIEKRRLGVNLTIIILLHFSALNDWPCRMCSLRSELTREMAVLAVQILRCFWMAWLTGTMTDPVQPVITIFKTGHKLAPKMFWDTMAPNYFVISKARAGDVGGLGDKMFILAVFPESSTGAPMSQPDPGSLGSCQPTVALAIQNANSQTGQLSGTVTVAASPYYSQVETSYRVRFEEQAELYTSSGAYNKPWVFAINITAGMESTSVYVQSMTVPSGCNYNTTTFFNSAQTFLSSATTPSGVQIDTKPPVVLSYKSSALAGSYTSGARIEIIVRFSRDVVFSELPDPSSPAAIASASFGNVPSGSPYMQLNSNAYAPLQGYALTNDSTRLLFVYQVGDGEATPSGVGLDLAQYTGIQLNGGSIKSAYTGIIADLSSMGGAYGSIGERPNPT